MRSLLIIASLVLLIGCGSDDVVSPTTGTIKGTVRNPTGTQLVENVQISTLPATQALLTNSSGAYTISDVAPGEYLVRAKYFDTAYANTSIRVTAGKTTTADLVLTYGTSDKAIIQGVILDQAGAPIANATVTTIPATSSQTSGSSGQFVISNIPPATYTVQAISGLKWGSVVVDAAAGSVVEADITIYDQNPTLGSVSGRITDNDQPVAGVIVSLPTLSIADTTGSTGLYQLLNVQPGTYTLYFTAPGQSARQSQVTIVAGQATTLNLELTNKVPFDKDGLLAYFPLDGDPNDHSVNERQGTILGGTFGADRFNNPNAAFSNNGSIANGIEIPHSADLNTFAMTFGAWFYLDEDSPADALLLGKNVHPLGDGYYFMIEDNQLAFVYTTDNFTSALRIDKDVPTRTWFWAAMVVNSDGTGTAIVDGTETVMTQIGIPSQVGNLASLRIGSNNVSTAGQRGLRGRIDHVVLYNKAKTLSEIQAIMETPD